MCWNGKNATNYPILILVTFCFGFAVVFTGCDVDPAEPEYTNPFDPYNPNTGGDPFQLEATITQNGVLLQWQQVSEVVIDGYHVHRGVMDSVNLVVVADLDPGVSQYLDVNPPRASVLWYRISAVFSGGESAPLPVEALRICTTPVVLIEHDSVYTNHEQVSVSINALRAQWMWLSNYSDFSDGQWQPFQEEVAAWELIGQDGLKSVYVKICYDDSSLSLPTYDNIILDRTANIVEVTVDIPERPLGLSDWIGVTLTTVDSVGNAWFVVQAALGDALYSPVSLQRTSPGIFEGGMEIRWGENANGVRVMGYFVDAAGNEAEPELCVGTFDLSLGMAEVPAGQFTMGIDGMDPQEGPAHQVYLSQYWIDRYLVTNYQYAQFLSDGNPQYFANHPLQLIENIGGGQFQAFAGFEHFPVVMVLWDESQAYASWAGKRLLTEAEWEKAARSSDARIYPWGNTLPIPSQANYIFSGDPWELILEPPLTPCGYYNGRNYEGFSTLDSPGPYGNYDLAGNVWEWVSDWFDPQYYSHSPYDNPQGPDSGSVKVLRGGDCFSDIYYLRSHIRFNPQSMQNRNANVGFRCASSNP